MRIIDYTCIDTIQLPCFLAIFKTWQRCIPMQILLIASPLVPSKILYLADTPSANPHPSQFTLCWESSQQLCTLTFHITWLAFDWIYIKYIFYSCSLLEPLILDSQTSLTDVIKYQSFLFALPCFQKIIWQLCRSVSLLVFWSLFKELHANVIRRILSEA